MVFGLCSSGRRLTTNITLAVRTPVKYVIILSSLSKDPLCLLLGVWNLGPLYKMFTQKCCFLLNG